MPAFTGRTTPGSELAALSAACVLIRARKWRRAYEAVHSLCIVIGVNPLPPYSVTSLAQWKKERI